MRWSTVFEYNFCGRGSCGRRSFMNIRLWLCIFFASIQLGCFGCQELLNTDIRLGEGATLLYFYATGCPNCELMKAPIQQATKQLLDEGLLAACYRINVASSGIDLAEMYNIRSVPAMVLLQKVEAVYESSDDILKELRSRLHASAEQSAQEFDEILEHDKEHDDAAAPTMVPIPINDISQAGQAGPSEQKGSSESKSPAALPSAPAEEKSRDIAAAVLQKQSPDASLLLGITPPSENVVAKETAPAEAGPVEKANVPVAPVAAQEVPTAELPAPSVEAAPAMPKVPSEPEKSQAVEAAPVAEQQAAPPAEDQVTPQQGPSTVQNNESQEEVAASDEDVAPSL